MCSILGVFLEVSTDSRRRHLWKDIFFKTKVLEKSPARVFFFVCGFTGFLRAPALQSASDCFCIVLGPQLSLISRT